MSHQGSPTKAQAASGNLEIVGSGPGVGGGVGGGFPGGSGGKESACYAGDAGSISRLGRSSGVGSGKPRQYSCMENPMDRGA